MLYTKTLSCFMKKSWSIFKISLRYNKNSLSSNHHVHLSLRKDSVHSYHEIIWYTLWKLFTKQTNLGYVYPLLNDRSNAWTLLYKVNPFQVINEICHSENGLCSFNIFSVRHYHRKHICLVTLKHLGTLWHVCVQGTMNTQSRRIYFYWKSEHRKY